MTIASFAVLGKFGFLIDIIQIAVGSTIGLIVVGVVIAVGLILFVVARAQAVREQRRLATAPAGAGPGTGASPGTETGAPAENASGGISLDK